MSKIKEITALMEQMAPEDTIPLQLDDSDNGVVTACLLLPHIRFHDDGSSVSFLGTMSHGHPEVEYPLVALTPHALGEAFRNHLWKFNPEKAKKIEAEQDAARWERAVFPILSSDITSVPHSSVESR